MPLCQARAWDFINVSELIFYRGILVEQFDRTAEVAEIRPRREALEQEPTEANSSGERNLIDLSGVRLPKNTECSDVSSDSE